MERSVESRSVIAYCDRMTYRQGDVVEVKAAGRGAVEVDLVRLNHPPDDPNWPVPLVTPVAEVPPVRVTVGPEPVYCGSYLVVEGLAALPGARAVTGLVYLQPTLLGCGHPQGVLSTLAEDGTAGFVVVIDETGRPTLTWGRGSGAPGVLSSPVALVEGYWHVLAISLDEESGVVALAHRPLRQMPGELGRWSGAEEGAGVSLAGEPTLLVGAAKLPGRAPADRLPGAPSVGTSFNGKLERPVLLSTSAGIADLAGLEPATVPADATGVLGAWDFSLNQKSALVTDVSGNGHQGVLVNMPARAVTGVSWDASVHDWTRAPEQYAAVHFHDDDLDDARWPVTASISLPDDLASAVYAVRLKEVGQAQDAEDLVPFVVAPAREREGEAEVLVVMPTYTYGAYANMLGNGEDIDYVAAGLAVGEALEYPEHKRLEEFPEIGGSIYDVHTDGSGWMYSTPRRPVLNNRPDWKSSMRDSYRHFSADLYLVAWLEKLGIAYHVVTDHLVHAGGSALLENYGAVVTGSHPEYISTEILDACQQYLDGGGNLLYLGGNGFYWVTTESDSIPELVEVRRGFAGTRTWTSRPGECFHSSTGELGGLWKFRGRPPNALVGVGLAAQAADGGAAGYRRSSASYEEPGSFLFEGVSSEIVGERGFDMGAAAGDEVDRYDVANGSPPWAVVVGSSLELSKYYKLVVEEIQITRENTGGDHEKGVRADLVLIEQAAGGFVFSVGSISWISSMAVDYFTSDTAQITENALRGALVRRAKQRGGAIP
ncbi:MAG: hypothetical protein JWO62_640 [Acidimicrobiaceae bacterium]|jgi:N,N-dimethylformamidase|nr:hypothetical protein [Acidimicrobiaceae bacterium]